MKHAAANVSGNQTVTFTFQALPESLAQMQAPVTYTHLSGNQLTAIQLLQRMGADPAALGEALYRDVKRRDELDRQTACERGLLRPGSLKEGDVYKRQEFRIATNCWSCLRELTPSFS